VSDLSVVTANPKYRSKQTAIKARPALSKPKTPVHPQDAPVRSLRKLLEPQPIVGSNVEMTFPGTFEDSRTGEEQIVLSDFIRSATTIYASIGATRQLIFSQTPSAASNGALVVHCKTASSATALKNLVNDLKSEG
jgi:hypothetical protein